MPCTISRVSAGQGCGTPKARPALRPRSHEIPKTPASVNLDWTNAHGLILLRRILGSGLEAGRALGVPQTPDRAHARDRARHDGQRFYEDCDFGALLEHEAKAAGLELKSEKTGAVDDGSERQQLSAQT